MDEKTIKQIKVTVISTAIIAVVGFMANVFLSMYSLKDYPEKHAQEEKIQEDHIKTIETSVNQKASKDDVDKMEYRLVDIISEIKEELKITRQHDLLILEKVSKSLGDIESIKGHIKYPYYNVIGEMKKDTTLPCELKKGEYDISME